MVTVLWIHKNSKAILICYSPAATSHAQAFFKHNLLHGTKALKSVLHEFRNSKFCTEDIATIMFLIINSIF